LERDDASRVDASKARLEFRRHSQSSFGIMAEQKSALPVVLGAMKFGEEGKEQSRVHDLPTVQKIIDIFGHHGHREIDTAR
jgi:hypothetical protein